MSTRRCLLLLLACCVVGLCALLATGLSYSERLSSHEGFHRVTVPDQAPPAEQLRRPRNSVLVVLDGLGHEEAAGMRSLSRLQARGQCRRTDVGPLSLSRPVYAVLSTGLEQDRTGARGNDDPAPLHAESIWDVARAAGLRVSGVSELPWWRELFPRGFDEYVVAERAADYFTLAPPADLRLIHPLYIDETGHESGAASPQYAAAVERADQELERFLDTLDLSQDLVIVTADHGHSLRGGHGGRQERIAFVRTCMAGPGVRHEPAVGELRSTSVGPALALLLGLRFPADMRAGDDELEVLWQIADPAAFPPAYLDERRAALERFRAENRAQLLRWSPDGDGTWTEFYARHRAAQRRAALPFVALLVLVLFLQRAAHRRRTRDRAAPWFGLVFAAGYHLGVYALQLGMRGSFDLSSIAHREDFLGFTVALAIGWTTIAVGVHLWLRRDLRALLLDVAATSLIGTVLCLAHPAALGWRLGFPVPPPALFFFPYFATLVLACLNAAGLVLCTVAAVSRLPAPASRVSDPPT